MVGGILKKNIEKNKRKRKTIKWDKLFFKSTISFVSLKFVYDISKHLKI